MAAVPTVRVISSSNHSPVGLGIPSSTSFSQGARPNPCPQGVHSVGREPNGADITVNVQGVEETQRGIDEVTKLATCFFGL